MPSRTGTHRIMLIAVLALALPLQQGWSQSPEGEAPKGSPLYEALFAEARRVFDTEVVELHLAVEDDQVASWSIDLPEEGFLAYLQAQQSLPSGSTIDRLIAWSRQANSKLAKITAVEFGRIGREYFNPELDCRLSVSGPVLPLAEYGDTSFYVSFTGDRLTYVGRPDAESLAYDRAEVLVDTDEGLSQETWDRLLEQCKPESEQFARLFPQPDPPAPSGESQMTFEIRADKPVWHVRERITGKITLRNTGTRRLHIESMWGPTSVDIHDMSGNDLEPFFFGGCILYDWPEERYKYLLPGEAITSEFSIDTDPAAVARGGRLAPPGRYLISRPPIENVVMLGTPAMIEVSARGGEYIGPRIMGIDSYGKRLLIQREDEIVELFDSSTMQRVAAAHFDFNFGALKMNWAALSPDGALLADRIRGKDHQIQLRGLLGPDPDVTNFSPPEGFEIGAGGFSPVQFSPDGSRLFARTNFGFVAFDVTSGKALSSIRTPTMWPIVSPEGDFIVDTESAALARIGGHRGEDRFTLRIMPWGAPNAERTYEIKGIGEAPEMRPGLRGVYLWSEFSTEIIYQPYDGANSHVYKTGSASVIGESPDGEFLLTVLPYRADYAHGNGATRVEVWSTRTGQRTAVIEEDLDLVPMFLGSSEYIACAVRGRMMFEERLRIYSRSTGALAAEVDLTPQAGDLPPNERK